MGGWSGSTGKSDSNLTFTGSGIEYSCSASTGEITLNNTYKRAGASSNLNFGTVKPVSIKKYTQIKAVTTGDALYCTIRTGTANAETTNINTATILRKALTTEPYIGVEPEVGYIVIGAMIVIADQSSGNADTPSKSESYSGAYTEIWLE